MLFYVLCYVYVTHPILAISYIHHTYQYIHHAYHTPYLPPSLSLCEESLIRAICVSTSITYVYARVLSLGVCVGYLCVAFACARVAPVCVSEYVSVLFVFPFIVALLCILVLHSVRVVHFM
jgi:hypothetical protein